MEENRSKGCTTILGRLLKILFWRIKNIMSPIVLVGQRFMSVILIDLPIDKFIL